MADPLTIEACILAGGLSSRMGTDKARLRLGGKSFLARIRMAASNAGFKGRVIRRDLVAGCGPLGGVYTALRTTQADAVLFLSCDMPLLTGSILRRLQARLTPKHTAVFVQHEQLGFPFLIRRNALPAVEAQLNAGRLSLGALAQALNASVIRVRSLTDARALLNINTPEEFAAAQQWWARNSAHRRTSKHPQLTEKRRVRARGLQDRGQS